MMRLRLAASAARPEARKRAVEGSGIEPTKRPRVAEEKEVKASDGVPPRDRGLAVEGQAVSAAEPYEQRVKSLGVRSPSEL